MATITWQVKSTSGNPIAGSVVNGSIQLNALNLNPQTFTVTTDTNGNAFYDIGYNSTNVTGTISGPPSVPFSAANFNIYIWAWENKTYTVTLTPLSATGAVFNKLSSSITTTIVFIGIVIVVGIIAYILINTLVPGLGAVRKGIGFINKASKRAKAFI
jgi:hypothetical protein